MEPANYYITTLTNAFMKLGPAVISLVLGYVVFIMMPFFFFRKSISHQKKMSEMEKKDFEVPHEKKNIAHDHRRFQSSPKREEKKQSSKQSEMKRPGPSTVQILSPEEILGFRSNETFSKAELKKRYYEKLKENHPDRVAMMGEDFKKLAEKNTKEINKAYEKLKNRAA